MKDEKDVMDLIQEFPDSQELNPNLTNKAKLLAEELYGEKRKKRKGLWWKILTAVLVPCCLAVAILTPILLKKSPDSSEPTKYFNNNEITKESTDIATYVKNNEIGIKFFSSERAEIQESLYTIIATGELAFFTQEALFIGADYFDNIVLYIVPSRHSFEELNKYVTLNSSVAVLNTEIHYKQHFDNLKTYTVDAKFEFESVTYYLTVQASDPNRWQTYVAELIG